MRDFSYKAPLFRQFMLFLHFWQTRLVFRAGRFRSGFLRHFAFCQSLHLRLSRGFLLAVFWQTPWQEASLSTLFLEVLQRFWAQSLPENLKITLLPNLKFYIHNHNDVITISGLFKVINGNIHLQVIMKMVNY